MVSKILRTSLLGELPGGENPLRLSIDGLQAFVAAQLAKHFILSVGDQSAAVAAGATQVTFRMPVGLTVTDVRASLTTASSSGPVTVDINEGGTTILSTKLSVDQDEKTSETATAPPVVSDAVLADDAEITIDVDAAGTGAVGLKVVITGTPA